MLREVESFELLILGAGEFANGPFGRNEQRQVNLIDNLSWSIASHHPEKTAGVASLCVPYFAEGFTG